MASSDPDPKRLTNGEISLQTDSQRRKNWAHFGDMRQSVEKWQKKVIDVLDPGGHELYRRRICNEKWPKIAEIWDNPLEYRLHFG